MTETMDRAREVLGIWLRSTNPIKADERVVVRRTLLRAELDKRGVQRVTDLEETEIDKLMIAIGLDENACADLLFEYHNAPLGPREPRVPITIRLPTSLSRKLHQKAENRGMSLNAWIVEQLERS